MRQALFGHFVLCALPMTLCLTGREIASHFIQTLSSGSQVYLPTDADYSNETIQRWNVFNPPTYIVSVKPALETDVQEVVSF